MKSTWLAILTPILVQMFWAFLNWATWFKSSEQWTSFAENHPHWARAIELSRVWGPHVAKALTPKGQTQEAKQ